MRKTYKAHTLLSITVNLSNGYYRHISFDSNSNGTSTYSTNDEDIQKAMEKHPKFGKYFTVENEPEKGLRCDKCFELRLSSAAEVAKDLNIPIFTTSMVISPHKNYEKLTAIGNKIAQTYNLEYLSTNFRKQDGFLKTNNISRSLNLYRQNYCGCKFAMKK